MRARMAAALCLLLACACARTSMTSMPAPESRGRELSNIMIMGNFADLGLRQQTEIRFADQNNVRGVKFLPSSTLLFPGREYSQAEIAAVLRDNSIDATLVISPYEAGSSSQYIPPTYTSGCTVWSSSSGCQQVTTTQSGGYTYSKPWAQFVAQLYDARTGNVLWYATAATSGNAYASSTTLVRSMADKTVSRLVSDGVIRKR
jgi:hypothetical protein